MAAVANRRCQSCRAPLPQEASTGRPRAYCNATCRKNAHRIRERKRREQLSNRDNWWTPGDLREEILRRWDVTLDAAACNASRLVPEYLGPDHPSKARRDALECSWSTYAGDGTVYLNPPYRPALLKPFLAQAVKTARRGTPVVGLIPASTDTLWWREYVTTPRADVEFLVGRLRFGGPHATGGPATFGSALVVWS